MSFERVSIEKFPSIDSKTSDTVIVEAPLEIWLQYSTLDGAQEKMLVGTTLRTPGNDGELALGFLLAECVIQFRSQMIAIQSISSKKVLATLESNTRINPAKLRRLSSITSSCGYCGRRAFDPINLSGKVIQKSPIIFSRVIYKLPETMRQQQIIFEATGGCHAAGLFGLDGNFIQLREDIGRHNALDKLLGWALEENLFPLCNYILLTSGRVSYEIMHKAIVSGARIVVAVGAPSSMAIDLARKYDVTLVGFASQSRFNIYSAGYRVQDETKELGWRGNSSQSSNQNDSQGVGFTRSEVAPSCQSEIRI